MRNLSNPVVKQKNISFPVFIKILPGGKSVGEKQILYIFHIRIQDIGCGFSLLRGKIFQFIGNFVKYVCTA